MPTIKFFPGKGNSRSPHAFAHGQKGKKKKEKRWTFVRRLLTTRLSGNRMKGGGGEKGIEISGDVFLRVRGKNVIVSS